MAQHRLRVGLGLASCIVAASAAAVVLDASERPPRPLAGPPNQGAAANRALPVPHPIPPEPSQAFSTTDANDGVKFAKDVVGVDDAGLDEEAAIEAALLTLIRARGRGTDARR